MRILAAAFARRSRAVRAAAAAARGLAGRGRPVRAVAQPLWCGATAAMPGRNKAASSYSCPELTVGQQAGEGSRDARGRSPHGEEEDRGDIGPGANLGDSDIVKSPSDPKQYRQWRICLSLELNFGFAVTLVDSEIPCWLREEDSAHWLREKLAPSLLALLPRCFLWISACLSCWHSYS